MKKNETLDRRILGEIYGASSIPESLHALCDRIGPRFAGSRAEGAAAQWAARQFQSFGISRVRIERFGLLAWTRGVGARLEVLSPVRKTLSVTTLPLSPATGPGGLSGTLADLWDGTPEQFEAAGEALEGGLLLTREGVPASYRRPVHRAEKFGRAVAAGAGAFLFAHPDPGCLEPTGCARFGREAEIPAAGLSFENAEFLRRLARRGPVRLRLFTAGQCRKGRSRNVVAEIPGSGRGGEFLVVGGHLDSHDISPGARDNAAGICVILEAARALARSGFKPLHGVRFVAFGSEEFGLLGSTHHAGRLGPRAKSLRLMLNVDSPPQNGTLGFQVQRAAAMGGTITALAKALGRDIALLEGLHPHSDHFPFFLAGAPVANLASAASGHKGGRGFGHTAADTPDKVDVEALKSAADLVARVLVRLAGPGATRLPWRPPGEIRAVLGGAGLEESLQYER